MSYLFEDKNIQCFAYVGVVSWQSCFLHARLRLDFAPQKYFVVLGKKIIVRWKSMERHGILEAILRTQHIRKIHT